MSACCIRILLLACSLLPYDVALGQTYVAVGDSGQGSVSGDGETWSSITNMQFGTNDIHDVAYGNGKFVAVGDGGIGSTSTDFAMSWNPISNLQMSASHAYAIAFGGGRFIVGGNGGKGSWSADGDSWSAIPDMSVAGNAVFDIVYGNGVFVAVGAFGVASYSNDHGPSWNAISNMGFGSDDINGVAFGINTFVAVGNSGKGSISTDLAATWSIISDTTFTEDILAVAFGNGTFVAVGGQGSESQDGMSWTAIEPNLFQGNGSGVMRGLAYASFNNKFYAVGDGMVSGSEIWSTVSYTGFTWGVDTISAFVASEPYGGGPPIGGPPIGGPPIGGPPNTCGCGKDGASWTMKVYRGLKIMFPESHPRGPFDCSMDGSFVTCTCRCNLLPLSFLLVGADGLMQYSRNSTTEWKDTAYVSSGQTRSVAHDGAGRWVTCGVVRQTAYSDNGYDWNYRSWSALKGSQVVYGANKFVFSAANKIMVSTRGESWMEVPTPFTADIVGLAFGGSEWMAVDATGSGACSQYWAMSWSTFVFSSTCTTFYDVVYANGRFLILCGPGKVLYTSSCNTSPVESTVFLTTDGPFTAAFGNGVWIAGGPSGKMSRSYDNAASWVDTSSAFTDSHDVTAATYSGSFFIAATRGGQVALSADAMVWTLGATVPKAVFGITSNTVYPLDLYVPAAKPLVAAGPFKEFSISTGGYYSDWNLEALSLEKEIRSAVYTSDKIIVGLGGANPNGVMWAYTTNPSSWSQSSQSTGTTYNALAWDPFYKELVGVLDNGKIALSTDEAITFNTKLDGNDLDSLNDVICYKPGEYAAVGDNGRVRWSTNRAASWSTTVISAFSLNNPVTGIAYGSDRFVVVTSTSKGAYSTGLTSWTLIADMQFNGRSINDVVYGNGVFVAVGDDGLISISVDAGNTWTSVVANFGNFPLNCVEYHEQAFVAAGNQGFTIVSIDGGMTWISNPQTGLSEIIALAFQA